MILKLSVLNNIDIKNRTQNKVANIVSPKSPLPRTSREFFIIFSYIKKKVIRSGDEVCWPYVNQ